MIYWQIKAEKRRVNSWICHREPGQVGTGTEETAENGLGAAHRSCNAKAATGTPVIVPGYR